MLDRIEPSAVLMPELFNIGNDEPRSDFDFQSAEDVPRGLLVRRKSGKIWKAANPGWNDAGV